MQIEYKYYLKFPVHFHSYMGVRSGVRSGFIGLIFLAVCTNFGWAQTTPQTSYTLQDNQSGATKSYVARDLVSMKNGFSFKAQTGQTFSAKTNPVLTCPISYTEAGQLPDVSTRDLTQNAVGTTPGSVNVSESGKANYNIPIILPPGTAGMQPSISVNYNSGSGIGLLGKGWSIGGISKITAVGDNCYLDGKSAATDLSIEYPQYHLALDGNRLIAGTGGFFYTLIGTFSRISASGDGYIVKTKDGKTMEYGMTADSRIETQNNYNAHTWYLNKVTDKHGNYIKYNYSENRTTGESRIESIEYTGNESTSLAPYNKVQFVYTTKSDLNTSYNDGYTSSCSVALHTIRITSEDALTREYEFKYTDNGGTRLSEVIEKGIGGQTAYNSTVIEWGISPATYPVIEDISNGVSPRFMDFNGDGRIDRWQNEKIQTIPIGGNKFEDIANGPSIPSSYQNEYLFQDMNGDGILDISYFQDYFPYCNINEPSCHHTYSDSLAILQSLITYTGNKGTGSFPTFSLKDHIPFYLNYVEYRQVLSHAGETDYQYSNYHVPLKYPTTQNFSGSQSFTNLGRLSQQIILPYNDEEKLQSYINACTYWGDAVESGLDQDNDGYDDYHFNTAQMAFGDFNGDGKQDVILSLITNMAKSQDDQRVNRLYTFSDGKYVLKRTFTLPYQYGIVGMQGVDVNGDGKTELLVKAYDLKDTQFGEPGSSFDFYMFDPNKPDIKDHIFDISDSDYPQALTDINLSDHDYEMYDFNGDGVLDYAFIDNFTNQINVSYNKIKNGTGKTYDLPFFDGDWGNYRNFGDFNGDGKTDILTVSFMSAPNPENIFESRIKLTVQYSTGEGFTPPQVVASKEYMNDFCINGLLNFKIGDFNGDGVDDVFFTGSYENWTGPDYGDYLVLFTGANNNQFVTSITNGLNQRTEIAYSTLNNDAVYTKGSGAVFPLMDYQGTSSVVSAVKTDNGLGVQAEVDYKYEGLKIHQQGLGSLGFTKTIQANVSTGISVESTYSIDPTYYLPYLAMTETKTATGTSIVETNYTNTVKDFGNKRLFSYTNMVVTTDKLRNIVTTTDGVNYDDYGNLLTSSTNINSEGTESMVNTYVNGGGWCPSRVEYSTLTQTIPGQAAYSRKAKKEYNEFGQLKTVITDPDLPKSVTTAYEFNNPYGNPSMTTISATGLDSRYETYLFDEKGRYITSKTNALSQTTSLTYDGKTGNVLTSTDINGLVTINIYNQLGILTQTILPDKNVVAQSLTWDNTVENSIYCQTSSPSNGTPVKQYYDVLGRPLRQTALGFDGTEIYADTRYNAKGLVDSKSEPYFSSNSGNISWESYSYDYLCRVDGITSYKGSTSIAYDGRTVTTTNESSTPKQVHTVTTNALGQTASATDAGGTITYGYYSSGLLRQTVAPGGVTTSRTYDDYGNRLQLVDPSAGTIDYIFNTYHELTKETRNGLVTDVVYDNLGRLKTKTETEGTTTYTYDNKPNGKGMLAGATGPNGVSEDYNYDNLGRVVSKTETVDGQNYLESLTFNATTGFLEKLTYPSGFAVNYVYNTSKQLSRINRADNNALIWKADAMTALGQVTQYTMGNNLVTTQTFDHTYLTGIQAGTLYHQTYDWDKATNNLNWRKDVKRNLTESFGYDHLDRLTDIFQNGVLKASTGFQANGNIQTSTAVGSYTYDPAKPYAVATVSDPAAIVSRTDQNITYYSFDKIKTITEGQRNLSIFYGLDKERVKQVDVSPTGTLTRYYLHGNYEKETGTVNRQIHYINTGTGVSAIYEIKGSTSQMYYVTKDHLGSINVLTNQSGAVVEEMSFDAWGRRRNPTDWTYTGVPATHLVDRGYTGHEHLEAFGLINMNGRAYDPIVGRFLSHDNKVNSLTNTQSYNLYSYCLNNPLKYVDPTGWTTDTEEGMKGYMLPAYTIYANEYKPAPMSPSYLLFLSHNQSEMNDQFHLAQEHAKTIKINADIVAARQQLNSTFETLPARITGLSVDAPIMAIPAINAFNSTGGGDEASGGGDGFNIWGDISNSFLVGAAANQSTFFRSSQIVKEGKFAVDGWKTYSNALKGNQYVSSASVNEAKVAFNSVAKFTSRISSGLTFASFVVTYANHEAKNVSDGRYYVQQTINAIGLFGPWGAGIAIGLGTVDAIWGDQIEGWIRE